MPSTLRYFALEDEAAGLGLSCDASGLSLAGVPLLTRSEAGFGPRPDHELDLLVKAAYGAGLDLGPLIRGLRLAARALDDGDVGRAMIAGLHLRLPRLDEDGAARVRKVDELLAKYSPDQPRDAQGRWTSDGSGGEAAASDAGEAGAARAGEAAHPPAKDGPQTHGGDAVIEPAGSPPLKANAVRIQPSVFQAKPSDPDDVPTIVKGFIQSGAARNIHALTEGDTREISGDVQSTPTGYVIENAIRGANEASPVRIRQVDGKPAPTELIPLYFHSHSSTPSPGSIEVVPGPSDTDVNNSRTHGVWQAVIDHEGDVYLIDPQGGLVRSDGSVLPYEQAMKTGTTWVAGSPQTSFPNLRNRRNAFGNLRNVSHGSTI